MVHQSYVHIAMFAELALKVFGNEILEITKTLDLTIKGINLPSSTKYISLSIHESYFQLCNFWEIREHYVKISFSR